MRYIVPYSRISSVIKVTDEGEQKYVEVSFGDFTDIVRHLCMSIEVDEDWYLRAYGSVAAAISKSGFFRSAAHHFVVVGYLEGRHPFAPGSQAGKEVVPFSLIKSRLSVQPRRNGLLVRMPHRDFLDVIRSLISPISVDSHWYENEYPDAKKAISSGAVSSAEDHFLKTGYFEGCWPYRIEVDEAWYLKIYPNLKNALESGVIRSAEHHFRGWGYREGRSPSEGIPLEIY